MIHTCFCCLVYISLLPLRLQIKLFNICETSKFICAGLPVVFMTFSDRMSTLLSNEVYYANLKTPTINIEIITELIVSGLANQIIEKKIQLAKERNSIYKKYFPDADYFAVYPNIAIAKLTSRWLLLIRFIKWF